MRILLGLLTMFAISCVGMIESQQSTTSGPDAGEDTTQADGGVANDAGSDATPGVDAVACDDRVNTTRAGVHKPGTACIVCHKQGGTARLFTIAGTLYVDAAGTTPAVGATVHIVDAAGNDLTLVTALNGNFWYEQPVVFPITTFASSCPDTPPMIAPVQPAGGDCNKGGCHDSNLRATVP